MLDECISCEGRMNELQKEVIIMVIVLQVLPIGVCVCAHMFMHIGEKENGDLLKY